ncbi:MAG: hypothetical protein ACO1OB_00215 [Archangium sp.]
MAPRARRPSAEAETRKLGASARFDVEDLYVDVVTCVRLGLRERALELAASSLLRGSEDADALLRVLDLKTPDDVSCLLADACAFASVGLREKGLTCLVGALAFGVDDRFPLMRALELLSVELPATHQLPLLHAEAC